MRMPFCHVCGSSVDATANYCADCGTSLDPSAPTSPTKTGPRPGSSLAGRTWMSTILGGAAGFVLAVVAAVVFVPMYVVGIMGGAALAGFLYDRGDTAGAKVGLLSGLVATGPVLIFIMLMAVVGLGGLVVGFIGEMGPFDAVPGVTAIALIVVVTIGLSVVANLVFGALGGFVGGALADQ